MFPVTMTPLTKTIQNRPKCVSLSQLFSKQVLINMGTTFGVYLLLFIPVAIVWYKVRKWLKVWYALSKIPGPYCYPLVGNIPQIKGGTEQLYQSFREFSSRFKIYRLWMCYVGSVNLTLAEDIEVKSVFGLILTHPRFLVSRLLFRQLII